jgi:hypothetical protein
VVLPFFDLGNAGIAHCVDGYLFLKRLNRTQKKAALVSG